MISSPKLRMLHTADAGDGFEHRLVIAGRRNDRPTAGQRDQAEPIARREVLDQPLQAIELGPAVADPHVGPIDHQQDDAGRFGDVVAAHVRQPTVDGGVGGAHRDQLEGVDRARLAVDGQHEVVGGEARDGTAVLVDDDRVDRDEVDAGAEHGLLRPSDQGHDDEGDAESGQPHGDEGATLPPRDRSPAARSHSFASFEFSNMDPAYSGNWIYEVLYALFPCNPNVVTILASGIKPAIPPPVTDSSRFVL